MSNTCIPHTVLISREKQQNKPFQSEFILLLEVNILISEIIFTHQTDKGRDSNTKANVDL